MAPNRYINQWFGYQLWYLQYKCVLKYQSLTIGSNEVYHGFNRQTTGIFCLKVHFLSQVCLKANIFMKLLWNNNDWFSIVASDALVL